eukprot:scaffold278995_cov32-Tisochrysis_lutea.AAC.1
MRPLVCVLENTLCCCCLAATLALHPTSALAATLISASVTSTAPQRDLVLEDLLEQGAAMSLGDRESARQTKLQELEDEQLERCRDRSSRISFDQCFYYDIASRPSRSTDVFHFGGSAQQHSLWPSSQATGSEVAGIG